jgi:hypothetical protein
MATVKYYRDMQDVLMGKTPKVKRIKMSDAPGNKMQVAARVIEKLTNAWERKEAEKSSAADRAMAIEMAKDYSAPPGVFNPAFDGTSSEDLLEGMNNLDTYKDSLPSENPNISPKDSYNWQGDQTDLPDDFGIVKAQSTLEQDADAAKKAPFKNVGMTRIDRNIGSGVYNLPNQSLFGSDNGEMGPSTQAMQLALLGQERGRKDAATAREQAMDDWIKKEKNKYRSPKTIKTGEGVFILNSDGSLGKKLGSAKAETEIVIGGGKLAKGFQRTPTGAEPIPGGSEDPKTIKRKKEAERQAALNIENIKKLPGRRSAIYASTLNSPTFNTAIENAISEASSNFSSGITQQLTGNIAIGPAFDLERSLDTIKSNIGFGELLRIKKAGGTLGALSEMETRLLQAMQGALDPRMSKDKLIPALKKVKEIYYLNLEEKKREFKEMYPNEKRPWEEDKNSINKKKNLFDAYYNSLPSGAEYIDPTGKKRIKQ